MFIAWVYPHAMSKRTIMTKKKSFYFHCDALQAIISTDCCKRNKKDSKRKETCLTCKHVPQPIDISDHLKKNPSVEGIKTGGFKKAEITRIERPFSGNNT